MSYTGRNVSILRLLRMV